MSTHSIKHDCQVLIVQDEGHAVPGKAGKGEPGVLNAGKSFHLCSWVKTIDLQTWMI